MNNLPNTSLRRLLLSQIPEAEADDLLATVFLTPPLLEDQGGDVSRAVLSGTLNLLLFRDLLGRVPTARQYVAEATARGQHVVFDHGALRTVALAGMGDLPSGEQAITRVLIPLGYRLRGIYPLERLGMTGRSYAHHDLPEGLPQFFVSELHPERFSPAFQQTVARITSSSRDPLTADHLATLHRLERRSNLPFDEACALLPTMLACFQRQHSNVAMRDYDALLVESKEMAWIATEGNAFNHATARVPDLEVLVAEQKALGRPLKDVIETSRTGRIKQTAFKADLVARDFRDGTGALVRREVPGSFYEFIQREHLPDPARRVPKLDLDFDSSNAQGIFKMTAPL